MTILSKLREKAASSISSFDEAENFLWNKWLRVPPIVEEEIGYITSKLNSNEKLHRRIPRPAQFGFEFLLAKSRVFRLRSKSFSTKSRVIRIFFGLGETYVENYISRLFGATEILFTGEILSEGSSQYMASKAINSASSVQRMNTDINTIEFLDSVREDPRKYWCSSDSTSYGGPQNDVSEFSGKKIAADFPLTRSDYYDPLIKHPGITDLLKQMYPTVYQIKLLELSPAGDNGKYSEDTALKVKLLDDAPGTEWIHFDISGVILKQTECFTEFDDCTATATFDFPDKLLIKNPSMSGYEVKTVPPQTARLDYLQMKAPAEIKTAVVSSSSILDQLLPEITISDEEKSFLYAPLTDKQKEAAEYLTETRSVLLTGKPGSGKTAEIISAIRLLFRKREAKSALIISDEIFIGSGELSMATGCTTGWEAEVGKIAPELSDFVSVRDSERNSDKTNNNRPIYICTPEIFFEKLADKMTAQSKQLIFDIIIIDEIQFLSKYKKRLQAFLEKAFINYLWMTSSLPVEAVRRIFPGSILPQNEFETISKGSDEKSMDIIRQNFWTAVDKDQKMEYDISLFDGKNGIIDIYKTGNPYRLQSKILMVLHNLNQVCNFYSDKEESPKSRLLLHHLETIAARKKKAVIFTQYDKQGVRKIAGLLGKRNINFVVFKRGMNNAEIREVEKIFTNDDSVSVLIADSHANGIRLANLRTDYIVHFDRWWIPAAQWQIDREIISARKKADEPLVIYNYLTKNLIEEKIIRLLYEKGLLEPAIFDTYGIDKFNRLITGEEWLKMFDLAVEKKAEEENYSQLEMSDGLKKLTHEGRIKVIAKFFGTLGYEEIKIFNSDECSCCRKIEATYSSKGIGFEMAAVVNLSFNGIDKKGMIKLLEKVNEDEKYHRIFLLTLTDFQVDPESNEFEDVVYIPVKKLSDYLHMLDLI